MIRPAVLSGVSRRKLEVFNAIMWLFQTAHAHESACQLQLDCVHARLSLDFFTSIQHVLHVSCPAVRTPTFWRAAAAVFSHTRTRIRTGKISTTSNSAIVILQHCTKRMMHFNYNLKEFPDALIKSDTVSKRAKGKELQHAVVDIALYLVGHFCLTQILSTRRPGGKVLAKVELVEKQSRAHKFKLKFSLVEPSPSSPITLDWFV